MTRPLIPAFTEEGLLYLERGGEPIGVHLLGGHAQEIFQRRAAIPRLLDVQFARRLAEPGDREDRSHRAPGHVLTTRRQKLRQHSVEAEHPPQPPGQPDVAEVPQPLEPDVLEADLHLFFFTCILRAWRIEERALWPARRFVALQVCAELRPTVLLARREITEIRDHTLPRSSYRAIRLDERPVGVTLAALSSFTSSQEHRSTPRIGCFEDRKVESENLLSFE